MKKQICVLTKSYKNGGYCVAGIDMETREWVRLVNSDNPGEDEIKKEQMILNGRIIDCLDVLEYDFIKNVPNSCQAENWLLNKAISPKFVKSLSLEELADIVEFERGDYFIFNKSNLLNSAEILGVKRSLYIFCVKNLVIEATEYQSFDIIKHRYKCKFDYRNRTYTNMSLTDPLYRDVEKDGETIENALVIASLPCVPYGEGFYYKFVAKIIPVGEDLAKRIELINNDVALSDVEILNCIIASVNPFTKKGIIGIDNVLRERLREISKKVAKRKGETGSKPIEDAKTVIVDGWEVYIDEDGTVLTDMYLLKRLQRLRKKIGDEKQVVYFVIATNKVLVRLATEKPTDKEAFLQIKGIRERWFNIYGQAFMDEIATYLENK